MYLILKSQFYVPISFEITPLIGTLNETYISFLSNRFTLVTVMALKTIILLKQNPNSTAALLIWLLAFFMLGILYFLSRGITWRIKATHNSLYYNSSSASGKKSRTKQLAKKKRSASPLSGLFCRLGYRREPSRKPFAKRDVAVCTKKLCFGCCSHFGLCCCDVGSQVKNSSFFFTYLWRRIQWQLRQKIRF